MSSQWKKLVEGATIQAAFVAIASRIVGSAFRCLETLTPQYQQSNVGNDPQTVCIRELSTISMAWCFALVTNVAIKPWAQKRKWSDFKIQFLTSVIGTAVAESIGRLIAYRKAYKSRSKPPFTPSFNQPRQGMNTISPASEVQLPIQQPVSAQAMPSKAPGTRQTLPTPIPAVYPGPFAISPI